MKLNFLIIGILVIGLYGCGENEEIVEHVNSELTDSSSEQETEFEAIIEAIDSDESLREGKSLFYTRDDGATEEVTVFVNDSNVTVKIYHEYTLPNGPSLSSNTYHFNDGVMIASKELFEEGTVENGHFVERKTYYDTNEKPIVTKRRVAPYEDNLDYEQFSIVDKQALSYKKPLEILNQTGQFETTFQGFIEEKPYLYMIVGENKPEGYYSSLVVQLMTPLIKKMQNNQEEMMGTQLSVDYETLNGAQGYVYQILMSVSKK